MLRIFFGLTLASLLAVTAVQAQGSGIIIDEPMDGRAERLGSASGPAVDRPAGGKPAAMPDKQILALLANASEEQRTRVAVMLEDQMKKMGGCQKLTRLDAENLWVVEPVSFYGGKLPSKGKWQVRYTATMCGQKVPQNVVFNAKSFNRVGIEVMMPGSTLADPALAADVWKSFQLAALKADGSCQTPVLTNTEVMEHPGTPGGIWREVWTGRMCNRDMAQVVSFYPTAMGTMFRMALPGADKAREDARAADNRPKAPRASYRPSN